ncbi:hypothetical protein EV356DRAFT_519223 [Viridothelium virens]|uniref:GPI anchored protein n=1 Tax=Viridothelium virens TaxID=1048519 RepID=A0A6A6GYV1_VIRVR|nr:hypothetical protein EV356DRAFT_519223 [Viridothelium virens]
MKLSSTLIALGFAAGAMAQSTTPSPEQQSAMDSAVGVYEATLITESQGSIIPSVVASILPTTLPSSVASAVSTFLFWGPADSKGALPSSFLTATPTVSSEPWFTYLPSTFVSYMVSDQVSVMSAQRAIITSVLDFTGGPSTTTTSQTLNGSTTTNSQTSTTSAAPSSQTHKGEAMGSPIGWTMGMAAGAVGVAAALL